MSQNYNISSKTPQSQTIDVVMTWSRVVRSEFATKILILIFNAFLNTALTFVHVCLTRHRASTSMYSLTFCVRVMSPECHHWKPTVQATAVMLRTPQSTTSYRPASHARFPNTAHNFENAPVTRRSPASSASTLRRAFALCRHIMGWTQACN